MKFCFISAANCMLGHGFPTAATILRFIGCERAPRSQGAGRHIEAHECLAMMRKPMLEYSDEQCQHDTSVFK